MGCVSSKSSKKDLVNVRISCPHHVVSLTSSTYGLLNLDQKQSKSQTSSPSNSKHEVINAWELMEGLEDHTNTIPISTKSPKSVVFARRSPRKLKSPGGKENKDSNMPRNTKNKMVSPNRKQRGQADKILGSLPEKCPPGGEDSVVIYTTSLRGIRKTYEECNKVRSIVEAHDVMVKERDVSMDSGFKEELRMLSGTGHVAVPVVFVKGRVVGGVNEVVKMEEEGQLGALLEGMERAVEGCEGCGGFRFVMCGHCNGSCKVLDGHGNGNEKVRCGHCNENGLVRCSICCC